MSLDGGDATNDMNLDRAETVTDRMSQDENNEPNDENEEVTNEMNQMNLMSKKMVQLTTMKYFLLEVPLEDKVYSYKEQ